MGKPLPLPLYGWTVEDGHIQPKWSAKNLLPVKLVDIIDTMNKENDEEHSETEESDSDIESEEDSSSDGDSEG